MIQFYIDPYKRGLDSSTSSKVQILENLLKNINNLFALLLLSTTANNTWFNLAALTLELLLKGLYPCWLTLVNYLLCWIEFLLIELEARWWAIFISKLKCRSSLTSDWDVSLTSRANEEFHAAISIELLITSALGFLLWSGQKNKQAKLSGAQTVLFKHSAPLRHQKIYTNPKQSGACVEEGEAQASFVQRSFSSSSSSGWKDRGGGRVVSRWFGNAPRYLLEDVPPQSPSCDSVLTLPAAVWRQRSLSLCCWDHSIKVSNYWLLITP